MTTPVEERPGRSAAAVSVRGQQHHRSRWLLWALLALAVLVGLGALIAAGDDGDDTDGDGDAVAREEAGGSDDAASGSGDGGGAGAGSSGGSGGGSSAGGSSDASAVDLSASGQALLPAPAGGYDGLVGEAATGRGVRVESVVADEAFWVGTGPDERVLVVLTSEARGTDGESPFQVEAGQSIDLDATVTALDGDPADFGVDPDEGGDLLRSQGVYLLASSIALS